MPPFDAEMVEPLHAHMRAKGCKLHLGDGVAGFEQGAGGKGLVVKTQSGAAHPADLVMLVGLSGIRRRGGVHNHPHAGRFLHSGAMPGVRSSLPSERVWPLAPLCAPLAPAGDWRAARGGAGQERGAGAGAARRHQGGRPHAHLGPTHLCGGRRGGGQGGRGGGEGEGHWSALVRFGIARAECQAQLPLCCPTCRTG